VKLGVGDWTHACLISLASADDPLDKDAFWSGFLWGARVPPRELFVSLKPHLLSFAKEGTFARRGYGDVLAGILLAGWGTKTQVEKTRIVSDDEMADVLASADESFRGRVLRQLQIWISSPVEDPSHSWNKAAPTFFRKVWPRQKFARTSATSSQLVNLLFTSEAVFSILVGVILPLLTTIEQGSMTLMPQLRLAAKQDGDIVASHAKRVLAVMYAILPQDARQWPYEADKVLEKISEADAGLKSDPRLIELTRRWNSR